MKLVDVNILLYVVNVDDPYHRRMLAWWENALDGDEPIGLAWSVLHSFLRLATHPKVFPKPNTPKNAVARVNRWLAHSNTRLVTESDDHWRILQQLIIEANAAGNLVPDLQLAALATSRNLTLVSCDRGFARWRQFRWENPMA